MRVIQPLLFRYGVDAVFSGHDEMYERSLVTGTETLADGATRPHEIHFYDVGIGGDGLRGPSTGADNPYRKFLAHENAPEIWNGKQLVSGGKHYGHLEVNVTRNAQGLWQAEMTPVYLFPLLKPDGQVFAWERRTYADAVTITSDSGRQIGAGDGALPRDRSSTIAALIFVGLGSAPLLLKRVHRGAA
jgi:hypothetical protein